MRASSALSTQQKWMDLIRQHEQSGTSVEVFCRERDVNAPSFYSWRKRLAVTSQCGLLWWKPAVPLRKITLQWN